MIKYLEIRLESIKKLEELLSEFGKVLGYKVNTQNSIVSLTY